MSLEAIHSVKEMEEKAKTMIADAKAKAVELERGAKEEAEKSYEEILRTAKEKRESVLKEAEDVATAQCKPIVEEAKRQAQTIQNISDEQWKDVVDTIVEEIVN